MANDYQDILDQSWDNLPETQVLPDGSWLLRGRNATYQAAKSEDGSPTVMFVYVAKEPMDDVSNEELDKLGKDYDPSVNRIFFKVFINDGSDWDRVRKHLLKHGVDTQGKSIKDSLKDFQGTEIAAYLTSRTYKDKAGEDQTVNEPSNFTKLG